MKFFKRNRIIVFALIIITLYFINSNKSNSDIEVQTTTSKLEQSICDSVWSHIDRKLYFKQSNQFYFIDESKFNTFFVVDTAKSLFPLNLRIHLLIYFNGEFLTELKSNTIVHDKPWSLEEYGLGSINEPIDLKNFLLQNHNINLTLHVSNITVKVLYHDINNNKKSNQLLNLNIKYLRTPEHTKPKSTLICSKCLFTDTKGYKNFQYWIELNKRAGYDKIWLCNNSIPNTDDFNQIFKKHADFIEIHQLKCLPNFLPNSKGFYVNHYSELEKALKQDVISGLILNEVTFSLYFDLKNKDALRFLATIR